MKNFLKFYFGMSDSAYGFKSLIEAGFLSNYTKIYPGSVDISSMDKFVLTSIGELLSKYV